MHPSHGADLMEGPADRLDAAAHGMAQLLAFPLMPRDHLRLYITSVEGWYGCRASPATAVPERQAARLCGILDFGPV